MTDKVKWPSWRFGPEGAAKIFEAEKDVPKGWVDHPSKVKAAPATKPSKEKDLDL